MEEKSPGAGRAKTGFEEESSFCSLVWSLLLLVVVDSAGGCCDEDDDIL